MGILGPSLQAPIWVQVMRRSLRAGPNPAARARDAGRVDEKSAPAAARSAEGSSSTTVWLDRDWHSNHPIVGRAPVVSARSGSAWPEARV